MQTSPVFAQSNQTSITLNLPDTTAAPGDTLVVPITISNATNILASDLQIAYDARWLTALRPVTANTYTSGWLLAFSVRFRDGSQDTTGIISISTATASASASGFGPFIQIPFAISINTSHQQVLSLTFLETTLNDRTPQAVPKNGTITIQRNSDALVGDFNADCKVGFQDFILFAQSFGSSSANANYILAHDLNANGQIDFPDFLRFIQHFNTTCP